MRLALFGGSFDPPHRGHLHIALAAAQRLRLDRVLLAPTGRQPLKQRHATPFPHRLAMAELLLAGHPALQASPIDAPTPDNAPNYTVDTLARLRPTLPAGAELFFLAGADSFLTLRHWRSAQALLRPPTDGGLLDDWILAARPGFPLHALAEALPPSYTLGPAAMEPGPVLRQRLHAPDSKAISLLILPDLDEPSAATGIREALAAGRPAPDLTPEVAAYIREHGLYTPVLG